MVAVLDCCREILKETSKEEPEETQANIFGPVTDQQPPEKQPETKVIEEYQNLILIHAFQVGSNMRPKLLVPALVEKVLIKLHHGCLQTAVTYARRCSSSTALSKLYHI